MGSWAGGSGRLRILGQPTGLAAAAAWPPTYSASPTRRRRVQGWDVLLRAHLRAFTAADNVQLLLLTQPFHSGSGFGGQMRAWAARELGPLGAAAAELPAVHVLDRRVAQAELPRLYRTAHCFVLPTR